MVDVRVPGPVGKTLGELAIRRRFGLTLIAIRRRSGTGSETTNASPGPDEAIEAGDVVALLGDNERVAHLDRVLRQ